MLYVVVLQPVKLFPFGFAISSSNLTQRINTVYGSCAFSSLITLFNDHAWFFFSFASKMIVVLSTNDSLFASTAPHTMPNWSNLTQRWLIVVQKITSWSCHSDLRDLVQHTTPHDRTQASTDALKISLWTKTNSNTPTSTIWSSRQSVRELLHWDARANCWRDLLFISLSYRKKSVFSTLIIFFNTIPSVLLGDLNWAIILRLSLGITPFNCWRSLAHIS